MTTLTTRATVAPDGTLHLDLPSGLPPGPVEVVVVVQSVPKDPLYGIWKNLLPDVDVNDELREMQAQWERSIEASID